MASPNAESGCDLSPEDIQTIEVLENEVAALKAEQDLAMAKIRQLMAEERASEGVYHHEEIFRLQQEKLRLDVDMKFRTNKINRIRLGIDGVASAEPQGGFLF